MSKVCLYTDVSRAGSDIVQIQELEPRVKEVTLVFSEEDYGRVKNKNLIFRGLLVEVKSYCAYAEYDNIYVANDFGIIPTDIKNQKVTVLATGVIRAIESLMHNTPNVYRGIHPYDADSNAKLGDLVKTRIDTDKIFDTVTKIEDAIKIINSPYFYISTDYTNYKPEVKLTGIGDSTTIIVSCAINAKKYFVEQLNSSQFKAKRKSFTDDYTIYRALKCNEENVNNLLSALECKELKVSFFRES